MPPLATDLRNDLQKAIIAARDIAEAGAEAALVPLAVARDPRPPGMSPAQQRLRVALRARARQLGGGTQQAGMSPLVEEIAYTQWHRMLFARFLAENDLLMHPEEQVAVSLQDCADLASEVGAADGWELAARYAGAMLPGIFRPDDPISEVRLAPEDRHALEGLVQGLPRAVFTADDGLGWVYQFWQTKKNAEVNASERKVGGADLPPVTQRFTEDYMVRFLLENSLGAWWAARHPDSPLLRTFDYLRYRDGGSAAAGAPAAGAFPGWPDRAAEVTVMDPCCGSGHFLVAAWDMLRRMRMEEEGLSAAVAADAVLQDNIHGLELDPRCTQIATFALLLAAWKVGGYRDVPPPQVACSGIAVEGQLVDWLDLANGNLKERTTLERLYGLFRQAPTLGSLIDPTHVPIEERMFSADYGAVAPLLERALQRERHREDPAALVRGQAAQAVTRAAELLAGAYTLVATNVPYLARGRQSEALAAYCDERHPLTKNDLAAAFVDRCRAFASPGGAYAIVAPLNWSFLGTYEAMRRAYLQEQTWNHFSPLGTGAFETISGEVVNVGLYVLTDCLPQADTLLTGVEADRGKTSVEKACLLREAPVLAIRQADELSNPDARITLAERSSGTLLAQYADGFAGIQTGDYPRFGRVFWELSESGPRWALQQSTVTEIVPFGGREHVVLWENGAGELYRYVCERLGPNQVGAWLRGTDFAGRMGVAVSSMRSLPCTLYTGELFDNNTAIVLPDNPNHLPAIWAFCSSPEYNEAVRRIDKKMNVTNSTLAKVPFDLERWQKVAEEQYPNGLPAPHSNDPTQWLFEGHPVGSTEPLQVAVARLLGYRWPQQRADDLDPLADEDGIVPLPAVGGEQPAAERLRALLAVAYGDDWSLARQQQLLADVGYGGRDLDDWLRNGYFAQHCKLFHNRPFIWHIWDGRRDGFSALVNYHRLDGPTLDKLIYTYLGRWIEAQRADRERAVAAADGRLVAALDLKAKLEAIRDGEPPYDIYVRWKPLHEQPIGWDPDLNDGVRLNVRPFVTAGVLRARFTINWRKDRGKNPDGSERINDLHYTREQKRAADVAAGG